ncbi:hypothetical protein [Desulfovibrio sp.]|uniref:hypothetical protein n=1 Tax=Desulfovibrio sp. TaxID=885 RepID=UPI0025C08AAF|nr:hypothetical protein [Desulfovibrio sp.]MCI7569202.1 hypothetical protein [Desulfovibrio sp.]
MNTTVSDAKLPYRISANNMHVTLEGRLSPDLAAELGGLVATHERECATFFIDVRRMEETDPDTAERLKNVMRRSPVPPHRIAYKGSRGFDLAVNGNKVLVPAPRRHHEPGHVCKGDCPGCRCKHGRARAASRKRDETTR